GDPVYGKTGTAEYGDEILARLHSWFAGFHGDLAVAVLVEDGGFGAEAAVPVAKEFFDTINGGTGAIPAEAVVASGCKTDLVSELDHFSLEDEGCSRHWHPCRSYRMRRARITDSAPVMRAANLS